MVGVVVGLGLGFVCLGVVGLVVGLGVRCGVWWVARG